MTQVNDSQLILIAFGANLPSDHGSPELTLLKALDYMNDSGLRLLMRSRFWRTQPVPISEQPWFVNGVCAIDTEMEPLALLQRLHQIEAEFGRIRTGLNAPRVLDLDLIAYGRVTCRIPGGLHCPHPGMSDRAFVLYPLKDIAPNWVHPITGETVDEMIAKLPADQIAEAM